MSCSDTCISDCLDICCKQTSFWIQRVRMSWIWSLPQEFWPRDTFSCDTSALCVIPSLSSVTTSMVLQILKRTGWQWCSSTGRKGSCRWPGEVTVHCCRDGSSMLQGLLKVYVLTRMQVHGLNGMGPVAASAADLKFEVLRRNEAHTNAEQPNNNC